MRNLKKGQHVFIAFQNGEAILDSQLRTRMYTSLANAERNTPPIYKGKIEYVEYAPTIITPNEWVSVEERLPEDEARQYIEDDLDGIGYLYPCLLTYKSPNTERIHVVRFYYDIIQKWFVNNGEELCEKGRCIAWMPLPAPYDRRSPEGEGNA